MLRNLNQSASGNRICGTPKTGVLGALIPATGDHGAGYAYNDISAADYTKEVRGKIVTWPVTGTLTAYEDTSFEFTAPDGTYSFEYQLYVDGVATGPPVTVTLQVGPVTHTSTGALSAFNSTLSGVATHTVGFITHTASGSLVAVTASVNASALRTGAPTVHGSNGALSANAASIAGTALRLGDIPPFTQEQLTFMLAYIQENLMVPTAQENAAAVLAAMQASPPPINVKLVNGTEISGSGVPPTIIDGVVTDPGDPWGPVP